MIICLPYFCSYPQILAIRPVWPLRPDSPEVTLVVVDSVSRAVRRRRLQDNYLHLLRGVATGTGHQTLPDASDTHVDVGEDDLTVGEQSVYVGEFQMVCKGLYKLLDQSLVLAWGLNINWGLY